MKPYFFALFIVLIFPFQIIISQNDKKLDSLLKVYSSQKQDTSKVKTAHAIYNFYYGHKPKIGLRFSLEGLSLSKEIDYKKGIAKSYYHKGRQFRNTRKIDSSEIYFDKALNIYREIKDVHNEGMMLFNKTMLLYLTAKYPEALNNISEITSKYSNPRPDSIILMNLLDLKARVFMRQTKYKEGIESALEALSYAKKLKSENKKAQIIGSLASLYHYTNNKEKSIAYKQEALKIYKKQNSKRQIANTLNGIGNSYYVIKQYDLALAYLEKSLLISRALELNGLIGITTFNIGKTYIRKGQIEKGIKYLKESIYYSRNISHNPLSESWALKKLADVYTEELDEPEKAIPLLNRAIIIADTVGNKDDLYQSYRDRSQAYSMQGSYKKALEDYKSYKSINDSVYNIERSREIERLKAEFDTKKNEQQIALQENEIDLLEQKAKVANLQRMLLGTGLILSLVLIGFGFYQSRQKIKRNRFEKEKLDAELIFKKKELTTHALHLAKKNEVLEGLKQKAEELKNSQNGQNGYEQLIRTINFDLKDDNNWENFSRYFQEVHKDFNSYVKQKFPEVTSNELRLMSLLKMNLSSKEIANILNISQEGIKKARYRLRKKLNLQSEDSLQDLVLSL